MHQRVTKKVNVQKISQRAAKVCICASACNKGKSLHLCISVQQKKKSAAVNVSLQTMHQQLANTAATCGNKYECTNDAPAQILWISIFIASFNS